jgi:hypothetical protein
LCSFFLAEQKIYFNDPKPGIGQLAPRNASDESFICGQIKLGFVMSKGQLEITIFEARNLNKPDNLKGK